MTSTQEEALKHFQEGYNCAESVVLAATKNPAATAVASAFGSGLSCTEGMCGALSGGVLALSLAKGKGARHESETLSTEVKTLIEGFQATFGSTGCSTLLGFSLNAPDAGEKFKAKGCFTNQCSLYVKYVTEELEVLLAQLPPSLDLLPAVAGPERDFVQEW